MMIAAQLFALTWMHFSATHAVATAPLVRTPRQPAAIVRRVQLNPSLSVADQTSGSVFVRDVPLGARVDVFANGTWLGSTIAKSRIARVALRFRLPPGARVYASVRAGSSVRSLVAPHDVQVDYATYHFDSLRTGWNPYETQLTTSDVNATTFGQLWSVTVDGDVYAQPLYASAVTLPDTTIHNVLYVATCEDTLYAFDADTGATLWVRTYADPSHGIYAVPSTAVSNHNVWPTLGIVGTPVMDRAANALFFVTDTKIVAGPSVTYHHMLHSIALDSGQENANSPEDIEGSVPMSDGETADFVSRAHLQRPALLVSNGGVYVAFGSHGDSFPQTSRGWVFSFDEMSLQQTGAFTTERDPTSEYLATIWMAGFGIASDQAGDIYFSTGNGAFDGGGDFGDSVLELTPGLAFKDFFTPGLIRSLPKKDLGSGGVMLLPDQPGSVAHLAVMAGKTKNIYLMNRDAMGGYAPSGPDRVVQVLKNAAGTALKGVHGGPAYYSGPGGQYVFFAGNQDVLKAFQLVDAPSPHLVLANQSTNIFPGEGGSTPVVSSNGLTPGTGIVWATTRPDNILTTPITLRAYDASDVSVMLFEAPAGGWQNDKGNPYLTPTVMNGKVYVGGVNTVTAFGLH